MLRLVLESMLVIVCAVLALWGAQRMVTLCAAMGMLPRRRAGSGGQRRPPQTAPPACSVVTVQVPLYNEPLVCARAVDASCALRMSSDVEVEVQILDDSDDDTTSRIVAERVAHWAAQGVDVVHIRRAHREGFKAGALAHGLASARGDIVAIFDADFVPAPDFLDRTVPLLAQLDVDVVQARWDHLNRDDSAWTRGQAALLDAHFAVEQEGRSRRARFFGFNGTAGVWRRAAIGRAGGWSARTLTEDLDLSVRAFLVGARFAYVDDVGAPAELPADVDAWRVQQHRWAKGALQTARARMGAVWRSSLGVVDKIDVSLKLLQNLCWPLLATVVVALPFAAWFDVVDATTLRPSMAGVGLGTLPALAVVAWAARARGASVLRALSDAVLALGVAAALSLHVARASVAGLFDAGDRTFHRTPKAGSSSPSSSSLPSSSLPSSRARFWPPHGSSIAVVEGIVGSIHLVAAIALCMRGDLIATPVLWLCGVSLVALALRARTTTSTAATEAAANGEWSAGLVPSGEGASPRNRCGFKPSSQGTSPALQTGAHGSRAA